MLPQWVVSPAVDMPDLPVVPDLPDLPDLSNLPDMPAEYDGYSGQGCNRWGWFETPTLANLQGAGISGPLYVGAGGNDISKAVNVGTWTATSDSSGNVKVTYTLTAPYTLAEVHVDLRCLPITKCAPGQYTFGATLSDVSTFTTPTGALTYPSCPVGSKAYLIIHAAVDKATTTTPCPPPEAA